MINDIYTTIKNKSLPVMSEYITAELLKSDDADTESTDISTLSEIFDSDDSDECDIGVDFIGYTKDDVLLTYNDVKPPEIKHKIIDTLTDVCHKHMLKYNDKTSEEYKYFKDKETVISYNNISNGIVEFTNANNFMDTFFKQNKIDGKLEFNIKDTDTANYLGIKLDTLKKRLMNNYAKTNYYFENVDYIRVRASKGLKINYYLNYQCFEKLVMNGTKKEAEIIRQYIIKMNQFMSNKKHLL